jgi:propionyl-CoA carboxylase alpha chain
VNTVPGYLGEIGDAKEAVKIADEIGYPVMIKASPGAAARACALRTRPRTRCEEGFNSSKSEAKSSFGDDRVFIEKFIVNPRHIEIQVLGDKHGNVHLTWASANARSSAATRRSSRKRRRRCSTRPRAEMGAQAVALAKAVDYDTAGTVEFVVRPGQVVLLPGDEHAPAGGTSGDGIDHRH